MNIPQITNFGSATANGHQVAPGLVECRADAVSEYNPHGVDLYRRIVRDENDTANRARNAHWMAHADAVSRLLGLEDRADADGDTLYLARDLEQISAETLDVLRYPLMARQLVPFINEVTPGADTWAYDVYDIAGRADWISNWATIIGGQDARKKRIKVDTRYFGSSYQYTVQDLERAAMARGKLGSNRALDAEVARSCRLAHEQFLDKLVADGDSDRSMPGLANLLDTGFGFTIQDFAPASMGGVTPRPYLKPAHKITVSGVPTADGPKTVRALTQLCMTPQMNTKGTFNANRLVMPLSWKEVLSQPYSNSILDGKSIENVFLQNQPPNGVKSIDYWYALDTKSALSGPRALAYMASPRTFKFVLGYDFKELPVQIVGGAYTIPTYGFVAGLVSQYPLAMAMMDLDNEDNA